MSSTGLSAAALLMSATSNERSKIAQKINSHEFSHELSQLQQNQPAIPGAVTDPKPFSQASTDSVGMLKPVGQELTAASPQMSPQELKVQAESAADNALVSRSKEAGKADQLKTKVLSEQKAEENLYITDMVALERIMAQLKLSADVRQACQGTGDKQGRIPFKTLRNLLLSQSAVRGGDKVAAQDVAELVSSLCQVQNGNVKPVQPFDLASSGSYSLNEINQLLKSIVKDLADQKLKSTPLVEQKSNVVPVADLKPASTEIETLLIPQGQLERLASQRIPKFSKAGGSPWEDSQKHVPSIPESGLANGSVARDSVSALSEATAGRDPLRQAARQAGDVMGEDVSADDALRQLRIGSSGADDLSATSSVEADSVSNPVASAKPNSPATAQGMQPFGADVRVLEHHFETDQTDEGVQMGSHAEAAASSSRLQRGDEPASMNETEADGPAAHASHERVTALEESGMTSRRNASRDEGHERGPEDSRLSSFSKSREMARAAESPSTDPAGFEKVLAEGATVGRMEQTAATRLQNSDATLRLSDASWPDALSKQIEESQRQGRSQMTIELEPESLGKLILRIEADRHHVTAWVSAQNEEVKGLLLNGAPSLRQHLEEHGLRLGQFTVDVGQQGGERRFAQTESSRKKGGGGFRSEQAPRVGITASLRPRATDHLSDRLISVFA